ncbi:MAG: FHA domain-containing protein [Fimbriimonadaceae bacterium]|nr:FHA domain-containing protein [Fimbriimonadaceae bacterium]QYK56917.1 MAG: FHA domain-containing protein [Fimbriimonadaceae bacterium]
MQRRPVCLLVLLLVAAASLGQSKFVRLEFPGEGDRVAWLGSLEEPGKVDGPVSASGTSLELPVGDKPGKLAIFVHDRKTGNVAVRALAKVQEGRWRVLPEDDARVFRSAFLLTHGGEPVSTAVVEVVAGDEKRTALVTPSDKGIAEFLNLPEGSFTVAVKFKSGGDEKQTPAQTFVAKLGAGVTEPRKIEIADPVETVPAEKPDAATGRKEGAPERSGGAAASESGAAPPKPTEPLNPLASIINLVIGLAVVGGVGYGIFWFVKNNPAKVQDALKQVGLGDQGQQAQAGGDPAPVPQAPQPIQPIVLGDGPPGPVPAPASVPAVGAVSNPRLVRADGSIYLLPEGTAVVSREEGAEIVLAGESTVSRRHAQITRTGDSLTIADLGSTNGTFVNGVRLEGSAALNPGDSVQFGSVALRYEA